MNKTAIVKVRKVMTENKISVAQVGKHPEVIKAAQKEISTMDLFVCGQCNQVFYFAEDFQKHKEGNECMLESPLINLVSEKAPQSFGFLLWKHSQTSKLDDAVAHSQYQVYKKWLTLEEPIRDSWKAAAETIFNHGRVALSVLEEVNVKIIKNSHEKVESSSPNAKNSTAKVASLKAMEKYGNISRSEGKVSSVAQTESPLTRMAKRTSPATSQVSEERVEKILAKRFNYRNRRQEYLVKWEGFISDQNTWEAIENLRTVQYLVDHFEKQLARQKQSKALQQAKSSSVALENATDIKDRKIILNKKVQSTKFETSPALVSSPIPRPSRTSKTKAMDQVKQWVSDNSKVALSNSPFSGEDDDYLQRRSPCPTRTAIMKRKADDSGEFSAGGQDFEEDLIPSHMVKRKKTEESTLLEAKTIMIKTDESKNTKINGSNTKVEYMIKLLPNSAGVEIKNNSQCSGITKNTSNPSQTTNVTKTDAKVRIVCKTEIPTLTTGILRATFAESGSPLTKKTSLKITANADSSFGAHVRQANKPTGQVSANWRTQGLTAHQRKLPINARSQALLRQDVAQKITTQSFTTSATARQVRSPNEKNIQISKSNDFKDNLNRGINQQNDRNNQQHNSQRANISLTQKTAPMVKAIDRTCLEKKDCLDKLTLRSDDDQDIGVRLCPVTGRLTGNDNEQSHFNDQEITPEQDEINPQLENLAENTDFLTNEDGSPLLLRGEDGTVYQVAGKNAEGQTVLVCQGPDGEQQFAYMAAADGDDSQNVTIDNSTAEEHSKALKVVSSAEYQLNDGEQNSEQPNPQTEDQLDSNAVNFEDGPHVIIQTEGEENGVAAQVLQADLPSPGGTRKVMLLLPDGQCVVTEMHEDELKPFGV